VLNRPLNYIDPTGHAQQSPDDSGVGDFLTRAQLQSRNTLWVDGGPTLNYAERKSPQGACDRLGSGGTLCMGHLWNFKPTVGVEVQPSGSTLVAAKSNDEGESGGGGGSGGGSGGDKKQKQSLVQRILSALSDPARRRPTLRAATKQAIQDAARKNADGDFYDPNTREVISKDGPYDYGHKPGYEWRNTQRRARAERWTREQVIEYENDPSHFQIEAPSSNRSHKYEGP
jgi:hypothetical protein